VSFFYPPNHPAFKAKQNKNPQTSSEILQQAANHIHPIQNLHHNNYSATTSYKPKIHQPKQKTHIMNPSPLVFMEKPNHNPQSTFNQTCKPPHHTSQPPQ
jgi:hypothetical protein